MQEWETEPFNMVSKDGYLYGRGTSDNKGPILAMVFAVKELLDRWEGKAQAGLPVNLTFVFEGEEEIGSPSLATIVKSHPDFFPDTKLIVISNSQWIGDRLPCLTYGMRGMICLTLRVEGSSRNLHSGNEGGVSNEPMADLCRLLATLVDSHHNILVPGFYDDVDPDLLEPTLNGFRVRE
jgi:acetylornithine deacetylase/succinyl-diaminopimelate desuccinylase-like protein